MATGRSRIICNLWCATPVLLVLAICAPPSMAQGAGTTVLPTETVPIPSSMQRSSAPSQLELKLWQKLPAKFYYNGSIETTFRIETNPFQTATKRTIVHRELPPGSVFQDTLPEHSKFRNHAIAAKEGLNVIGTKQEDAILRAIAHTSAFDNVYRANPNMTAGWSLTPNTQIFGTYFLIRDSLMRSSTLNSTTQAVGIGAQYTKTLGKRASIQPQLTIREMYQTGQPNVYDYLPAVTLQYAVTPNLIVYENSLLQVRQKHFVDGPMRELDPFHTIGMFYTRGRWQFSASGTFLQNFRNQFGHNSLEPINNNSVICDFEVDRQVIPTMPSVQAIVRAEPVWNFNSNETSGLSGMDFRLYYGIRVSTSKPALAASMDQLRNRYLQTRNLPTASDISD